MLGGGEPGGSRVQQVFVGDIQGCADEFEGLLESLQVRFGVDFELWVVGDVVNRGPQSLRALNLLRDWVENRGAHYVLGNHEIALLRTAAGLRSPRRQDTFGDVLERPASDGWFDWLRSRPLVEMGRLGRQPFAIVHAGVHPDWSLDELVARGQRIRDRLGCESRREAEQFLAADPREESSREDVERLTRCRSVAANGDWFEEPSVNGADPWHLQWARRGHGYGVVYGHWSLQGLHVAPGLRGLDTGCVHHGRGRDGALTAWLPDPTAETPFDAPDTRFLKIPAGRVYPRP